MHPSQFAPLRYTLHVEDDELVRLPPHDTALRVLRALDARVTDRIEDLEKRLAIKKAQLGATEHALKASKAEAELYGECGPTANPSFSSPTMTTGDENDVLRRWNPDHPLARVIHDLSTRFRTRAVKGVDEVRVLNKHNSALLAQLETARRELAAVREQLRTSHDDRMDLNLRNGALERDRGEALAHLVTARSGIDELRAKCARLARESDSSSSSPLINRLNRKVGNLENWLGSARAALSRATTERDGAWEKVAQLRKELDTPPEPPALPEIQHCPACGSSARLRVNYVVCNRPSCAMRGSTAPTLAEAIRLWNRLEVSP